MGVCCGSKDRGDSVKGIANIKISLPILSYKRHGFPLMLTAAGMVWLEGMTINREVSWLLTHSDIIETNNGGYLSVRELCTNSGQSVRGSDFRPMARPTTDSPSGTLQTTAREKSLVRAPGKCELIPCACMGTGKALSTFNVHGVGK